MDEGFAWTATDGKRVCFSGRIFKQGFLDERLTLCYLCGASARPVPRWPGHMELVPRVRASSALGALSCVACFGLSVGSLFSLSFQPVVTKHSLCSSHQEQATQLLWLPETWLGQGQAAGPHGREGPSGLARWLCRAEAVGGQRDGSIKELGLAWLEIGVFCPPLLLW